MLEFYGPDIMLLLAARCFETGAKMVEATAAFVTEVQGYRYG